MSNAPSESGYFATLGVTFRADENAIAKAYKKLAIKMHPDKNPSPSAVDEFQRITTSYHVIMDKQKRDNYLRLFMLRCYMSQEPPSAHSGLRPHYAFVVGKSKNAMGTRSDRLLTIDLLELKLQNFKKDTLQKEFHLSKITGVQPGEKPLELTIHFKDTHPYYIRTRCQEQHETLTRVLQRVIAAEGGLSDEALQLLCDDSDSPPSSVHKSKVIKRAERQMGSALINDWQPRFMVMGSTQLVIFRDVDLQYLVNIIPLSMLKFIHDPRDQTCFQLQTSFWKASFRVLTEEVAKKWKIGLAEQKAWICKNVEQRPRPSRPSVIYSEADLAGMHAPANSPAASSTLRKLNAAFPAAPALPALPAPELAPCENDCGNGWLQYRDGLGRAYYYNAHTNETSWSLPDGLDANDGSNADADEGAAALSSGADEGAAAREAQLAALREEGPAVTGEVAFAEAKGSLLGMMQAMERSLLKARRAVEADRPLQDLAPLFEGLRGSFDTVASSGADFERAAMQRAETQRTFMASKAAYLDGLQAHVLGEDGDNNSVAGKIFRKGAYVADTFGKLTNMRGVL